jgi:hypothetical protein
VDREDVPGMSKTDSNTLAPIPLDRDTERKLNRYRDMRERRDRLIVQAHANGASLREIGDAVGMSHVGVLGVLRRYGMAFDEPSDVEPTS